jgi:hypothetical protein
MEEEAVVATVESLSRRTIGESLQLEFVNVKFRVLQSNETEGDVCKVVIKKPDWLVKFQASEPLSGYLLESGEFSGSFRKDNRIAPG